MREERWVTGSESGDRVTANQQITVGVWNIRKKWRRLQRVSFITILLVTPTVLTLTQLPPFLSLFPTDPIYISIFSSLLFSLLSFFAVLFSLPFFLRRGSSTLFTATPAFPIFFHHQETSNLLQPLASFSTSDT